MKVVQRAEAKNEPALHLEYVKRGGTIRIIDHDQPIADLVPVSGDNDSVRDGETLLAGLEKQWLVRRGTGGPATEDVFSPGPAGSQASVLDALLDERRGSR